MAALAVGSPLSSSRAACGDGRVLTLEAKEHVAASLKRLPITDKQTHTGAVRACVATRPDSQCHECATHGIHCRPIASHPEMNEEGPGCDELGGSQVDGRVLLAAALNALLVLTCITSSSSTRPST